MQKGMIEESDREMYEYAFQITAEAGLFVLFCFLMALHMHMLVDGLLFFIIFVPLRSYAGGLHMDTFKACFLLSCLAFSGVLLLARYIEIPGCFSFLVLLSLEFTIYWLYPVENKNREVDREENAWFKRKLRSFLLLDFFLALACLAFYKERYLLLMGATFLLIAISMIIAKAK